jgi:hypothetical protein
MPFHGDIAAAAFQATALPPPPRTVEHALTYITRLLSMLPPAEQAGYVKSIPGGENTVALPDGTLVRVSRVMYPDGQIYKVMNDAPNGNPQWVAEDVRPDLYVSFPRPVRQRDDPPAVDLTLILARLDALETQLQRLEETRATTARVEAINDRLNAVDEAAVKKPLPEYVGSNWAGRVISTPRPIR